MLPRWHIVFGFLFTAVVWLASPDLNIIYVLTLFFSTFLIDVDHYVIFVKRNKNYSLNKAFNYFLKLKKKGDRKKDSIFIFHTVEFHILVALLSFFHIIFLFVFIGMVFHSLLDIFTMIKEKSLQNREFFLISWIARNRN
ncbi:hypothetical protein COU62_03990 [Candidatus Pacearchaeota archaeon CG10_big_fil_rev_8_21_14_0_10_35_219]|nr:hypothetical protein [Candidatus Pacearchaeota archaeon]OIO42258.1 MAG: hypothetical protein AUJ63_03195 [Candidatus Pacearchaeota archaeon CG1_02_35_32]PIO07511.1 MAG: hypothetical protein COU62_03990 [Candidatus Pacearchaeota archaeon CG10_big_fil_rev_8_21_14_0_10_35_219]PIY81318.1 MAG: hypothetical protein COY79_03485 [Candidatus Pacearchaeota archaeon CG_4_10_14_0_8_um_filter_35_169]PIZ80247.1 MAG: hypothetical protein COY00_02130 [Candidatus Pacearchaeota archaeon CG_4_10_14_0_2_um_filt